MDGQQEIRVPEKVLRLKPSIRQYAEVDVSKYTLPGSRGVRPYEDGGRVWIDPYIDSAKEREFTEAWEELQSAAPDSAEEKSAWDLLTGLLDEHVWGFNLTDKFGQPLPQPGEPGCWDAVPSWFMAHLMQELAGGESPGERRRG